ncbi:DUF2304 domain-containing protein [Brachybacterium nesterenkovii]|uniref:POSSIBLE CONSERVED MEMBRANE PROTEIN n=1 Tax=Brachybacterium nesterenkovii TaxID=47847 RepID=A0A1X6WY58_9MICO|nr:DUF2304 domain-containing protein [Brachybacterium nesterenkovii]SLM90777.1 POSSIBLE CONSERVED MEMBRANE PROTEIN [Brachybacterium nesterenkovii]
MIQLFLLIGIVGIAAWLFVNRGAKQLAVRRLLLVAFTVFAVLAVLFPTLVTGVAHLVGVGRGADLLLYLTVVVLLGSLALQEARTKSAEVRTTYLARRIAIDESEPPVQYRERVLGDRSR